MGHEISENAVVSTPVEARAMTTLGETAPLVEVGERSSQEPSVRRESLGKSTGQTGQRAGSCCLGAAWVRASASQVQAGSCCLGAAWVRASASQVHEESERMVNFECRVGGSAKNASSGLCLRAEPRRRPHPAAAACIPRLSAPRRSRPCLAAARVPPTPPAPRSAAAFYYNRFLN